MEKSRLILVSTAAVSVLALAVACSKSDGDSENGGTGGTGASSSTSSDDGPVIGGGSTSTNGSSTGSGSGGTVATGTGTGSATLLTEEQVAAFADSACNGWSDEAEGLAAKLELVIDTSSSMSGTVNGSTETKWETTREALREAIVGVTGTGLSANTAVGLMFYPGVTRDEIPRTAGTSLDCLDTSTAVPMALLGDTGSTQRGSIDTALTEQTLYRGTPTNDAYTYALTNYVLSEEQLAISGASYMLLITDGMPTLDYGCFNTNGNLNTIVPTDPIIQKISDANTTYGIKTFVIGSPGSDEGRGDDGYDWLSAAATAGGTAKETCTNYAAPYCHMDMTQSTDFSADLASGLATVASAIDVGCKYEIPTTSATTDEAVDTTLINPVITYTNGESYLIGVDSTGACAGEGFKVNSETELELCPETCLKFEADDGAKLELYFGCSAEEVDDIITIT